MSIVPGRNAHSPSAADDDDDDALTSQYRQQVAPVRAPTPVPPVRAPTPVPPDRSQQRDSFAIFPSDIDLAERKIGPYQLSLEIASGGMATVYLAEHDIGGLLVPIAIKRIHPHLAKDQRFVDMFSDEARIAACINHPYVCRVFDYGRAGDSYYIAMEFLHGESLSAVFRALTPERITSEQHPRVIARIIANLAEGLHAAHVQKNAQGVALEIVHRDVSLQNLFVLSDGTVRVTDFGVARATVRAHQTDGTRVKGKLAYASPEQVNQQAVDRRSDIWSLGVVTWELLTGRRLFRSKNEGEAIMKVLSQPIPSPSRFTPYSTQELDAIVMRALERDPHERFASARDFSRALEQYLAKSGANVNTLDLEEWLQELSPGARARADRLAARVSVLPVEPVLLASSPQHEEANEPSQIEQPLSSAPPRRSRRTWQLQLGLVAVSLLAVAVATWHLLMPLTPPPSSVAAGTGSVVIETKNGDALALQGDRKLGLTPLTVSLPAGAQNLRLEPISGGAAVLLTVIVAKDAVSRVTVSLPDED